MSGSSEPVAALASSPSEFRYTTSKSRGCPGSPATHVSDAAEGLLELQVGSHGEITVNSATTGARHRRLTRALSSIAEDVTRVFKLRVIVDEGVAVLTDVGVSPEGVTAITLLFGVFRVHLVATVNNGRCPAVGAVPPDPAAFRDRGSEAGGHGRVAPRLAVVEAIRLARMVGRLTIPSEHLKFSAA